MIDPFFFSLKLIQVRFLSLVVNRTFSKSWRIFEGRNGDEGWIQITSLPFCEAACAHSCCLVF